MMKLSHAENPIISHCPLTGFGMRGLPFTPEERGDCGGRSGGGKGRGCCYPDDRLLFFIRTVKRTASFSLSVD